MATNNYVSTAGGGFQGPQSDYWMYGLGDMGPARNDAAHTLELANQGFLNQLTAQKEVQSQREWMGQAGLRKAQDETAMSKTTLENLANQQGITEQPIKAKKSMQDIYDSMDEAKRIKMKSEMTFLGMHGEELLQRVSGTNDPAEKNKIWSSFMQTYGGDTTGMERWTPQNEQKVKAAYKLFVENPEFQRMMSENKQKHLDKMEEIGLGNTGRIEATNKKATSDAKKIISKIPGMINGRQVETITFGDGHTETIYAAEGQQSPTEVTKEEKRKQAKIKLEAIKKTYKDMGLEKFLGTDAEYLKALAESQDTASTATPTSSSQKIKPSANAVEEFAKKNGYEYDPSKYNYTIDNGKLKRQPK